MEELEEVDREAGKNFMYVGWMALGLTAVVSFSFEFTVLQQVVPLLLSAVFLGLPHGAVDLFLFSDKNGKAFSVRKMLSVGLIYLLLGSLTLALWYVSPVAGFLAFILITLYHWGSAELFHIGKLLNSDYIDSGFQKVLAVLARGGAPMILPLVAFPEYYRYVAETLVWIFSTQGIGLLQTLFTFESRILLLTAYLVLTTVYLLKSYRQSSNLSPLKIDAFEILILTIFFLTVPSILAIGVYFCFWHSLRHIYKYSLLDQENRENYREGEMLKPLKKFYRQATPLTLLSLLFLAILHQATQTGNTLTQITGTYLLLISILTPPHIAVDILSQ